MVGTTGFEPATSRTPSVRATRLRYVPTDGGILQPAPRRAGIPLPSLEIPRPETPATAQRAYHSDSRAVNKERSESRKSSRVFRLSMATSGEAAGRGARSVLSASSPPW